MGNGGGKPHLLLLFAVMLIVSSLLTMYVLILLVRLEEVVDEQQPITLVIARDNPTAILVSEPATPVPMSTAAGFPTYSAQQHDCYYDGFYYPYC